MSEADDISGAALSVRNGTFNQIDVDLIDQILNRGDGDRLLSAILADQQTVHKDLDDAASKAMLRLEALGNVSKSSACILMAHLYPIESYAHDVFDGIELWIDSCASVRLTDYLRTVAQSEKDPDRRRRYEELLEIRRRSEHKGGGVESRG